MNRNSPEISFCAAFPTSEEKSVDHLPREVPIDDGPELAVPQSDVVEVEADVLDLDVPLEGDPTPPEPAAVRGGVSDGRAEEAFIAPTHRLNLHLHNTLHTAKQSVEN